jgi:hypothetical protein
MIFFLVKFNYYHSRIETTSTQVKIYATHVEITHHVDGQTKQIR